MEGPGHGRDRLQRKRRRLLRAEPEARSIVRLRLLPARRQDPRELLQGLPRRGPGQPDERRRVRPRPCDLRPQQGRDEGPVRRRQHERPGRAGARAGRRRAGLVLDRDHQLSRARRAHVRRVGHVLGAPSAPDAREAEQGHRARAGQLSRLTRPLHLALGAVDRHGPTRPQAPDRGLEDVREQRRVPLQGGHVRVLRRRARLEGPWAAARLLHPARLLRSPRPDALSHRLGHLDGVRRRGQRVREHTRRAGRDVCVHGFQPDRRDQAPAQAVEQPDHGSRQPDQPHQRADLARRQELARGRQQHRCERRAEPATRRQDRVAVRLLEPRRDAGPEPADRPHALEGRWAHLGRRDAR